MYNNIQDMLNAFDDWYKKLTEQEKNKLLEHIDKRTRLTEGFFAGPAVISKSKKCPVCGSPLN